MAGKPAYPDGACAITKQAAADARAYADHLEHLAANGHSPVATPTMRLYVRLVAELLRRRAGHGCVAAAWVLEHILGNL